MRTAPALARSSNPAVRLSADILRHCVECGLCTATCPTYVLSHEEDQGPRGRNLLIHGILAGEGTPGADAVGHIDSCLLCLACADACPSGVDFMHLMEVARARLEKTFRRPSGDRMLRHMLATVLPHPTRFRQALRLSGPLKGLMAGRLEGMASMTPSRLPAASPVDRPQVFAAEGRRLKRVALMTGCAQQVLRPSINEATVRLLTRHGCEVVVAAGAGCCGALVHHLGREGDARAAARANVAAWSKLDGLDAVIVNASGCGTTVKDYGFLLAGEAAWAGRAGAVAALARDLSEFLVELGIGPGGMAERLRIAHHLPCSMRHGQGLRGQPAALLESCGFEVVEVPEAHMCCGSAGTHSLLFPEVAARLARRKAARIEALDCDLVATSNIGCLIHIAAATGRPVVHAAELLDWATGGPRPSIG